MDTLPLSERIQQTLDLGESQFREFKSAWEGIATAKKPRDPKSVAKDIAETLVAFANADDGELLIGVEDDGSVTGFQYTDDTIEKLLQAPTKGVHCDTPLESPIARRVKGIEGKEILYFAIEKGTRFIHQTSDGRCLQRKDRENRPVSAVQLQFERQEQISREYDRQFVDGATVLGLNIDLVRRISDSITKGMSHEKFLQYLGLAEYGVGILRLRRAALLLFAKDIAHWHPRCEVRVVRVKGTELKTGREYTVTSEERTTGNILELVSSAWEKLRPHLVETKLTPDGLFRERVMYPEDACREALINAITHRDYGIEGKGIEIMIFDDRMEVHSPGGLLSTISVEGLKKLIGVHESRNALVARVLRELGYVREMGEGIRRIFLLMRDADLVPPEMESEPGRFSIVLRHRSVFSDEDQGWLDGFKSLRLTREEMLVALLGKGGNKISAQQIYERLNLVDWDVYRKIVDQLQTKGILYSVLSRGEKAKLARSKHVSQRVIQRFAIRQPQEVERALPELFDLIRRKGPVPLISNSHVSTIVASLPPQHPYHLDAIHLTRLLKLLGLIDDSGTPTSLLTGLWGRHVLPAGYVSVQPAAAPPIPLGQPAPASRQRRGQVRDIYVGNIDYDVTPDELKSLFDQYGNVLSVKIPPDFVTQRARGFAFVKMSTEAEADRAVAEVNGKLLRGRVLRTGWAR